MWPGSIMPTCCRLPPRLLTRIVLATLNARYIHASLGLRYLLANLGGAGLRATRAARVHHRRRAAGRGGCVLLADAGSSGLRGGADRRFWRVHLERDANPRGGAPAQSRAARCQGGAGRAGGQPRGRPAGHRRAGRPCDHRLGRCEFCQAVPRAAGWPAAAEENHPRRAAAAAKTCPALRRVQRCRPGAPPAVCGGLARLPVQVRVLPEFARQDRLGL